MRFWSFINGGLFIILNLADAQFTKIALADGATEIMPLAKFFGSDLLIKGLLALLAVGLLIFFKRSRLLPFLNIGMGVIVIWGCIAVYLLPILF